MRQISNHVFCHEDTCNVYVILNGSDAVLIDFGDGSVLGELQSIGVSQVTDILMTHHHRDQSQGLVSAPKDAKVWVPHVEQDLFTHVESHWQSRAIYNNYNVRQDRFSLLEPVPIYRTLKDYEVIQLGGVTFEVIPTPGHTIGSISLLGHIDDAWFAFTGDLIYRPGKVWSLSATQWTYNGAQGVPASILSLLDLKARGPEVLLPSHGSPMRDPGRAIDLLVERLHDLLQFRNQHTDLLDHLREPFRVITPHLLYNRTSFANSYVVISSSGKALLIDYGYDFCVGLGAGEDRASRRPWLYTIAVLKRQFNVTSVDVVIATHYHDDHVAGLNLLQAIEGSQVWAGENFADILEHPGRYDLPCLWYDPISVDKKLPLNQPIRWEEYEFVIHEQPGHTLYADAIEFMVDGKKVLAIGDQQDNQGYLWNYVYQNRFRISDYRQSADLYLTVQPDIILSGHWDPLWVEPEYLHVLQERGQRLEQIHQDLLPLEEINLGAEGFAARIYPYQITTAVGEEFKVDVQVVNPLQHPEYVRLRLVVPADWRVRQGEQVLQLNGYSQSTVSFQITPPANAMCRRSRIAVDMSVGNLRLGQQAEALVDVVPAN